MGEVLFCSDRYQQFPVAQIRLYDEFMGDEELLGSHGVQIEVLHNDECVKLMRTFIKEKPELWNEDISV